MSLLGGTTQSPTGEGLLWEGGRTRLQAGSPAALPSLSIHSPTCFSHGDCLKLTPRKPAMFFYGPEGFQKQIGVCGVQG